ncbi:MAG: protoporphyrinogen oxidase [Myxococcales bacterium]|nr:protoporphyrinogen oxidase [Myxococcales bacterium]
MNEAAHVVVVGAGITGLATAYFLSLHQPRVRVTLVERRERLGGNIETESRDGFLLDGGPDSFLSTKREGAELCRELGLGDDLIVPRPEASKVYMVHRGRLEPMPGGMALAIPTKIGPMLSTPLVSFGAKLRMLGDLVLPRRSDEGDESIEDFIARRFGREAARRLAAPLLGGIYAGDIGQLSVLSTFPQLVDVEKKHGSLARGLLALQLARAKANGGAKPKGPPPSPFMSLKGGMGSLVTALADKLPADARRLGRAVLSVERTGERWTVHLDGGETLDADAVVFACPAHATQKLVPEEKVGRELAAIPYLSTATVFFALPRAGLERPLDGVGFVAPKGEAELIAGTWVSSKWDGRAPADHVLVRAFLGGARAKVDVAKASDDELLDAAKRGLEQLLGGLGTPTLTRIFRYIDANPQPIVGHGARLARIEAELAKLPGLYVAGAAYDGVGIPDCVRQARAVAQRVIDERLATS